MKPQDKAIELIGKMMLDSKDRLYFRLAKQCALIAVDECILTSKYMPETLNYWEQVKQEIQKL